jgi:16S rRNA (cytosine1402-N4)-methyltransferase
VNDEFSSLDSFLRQLPSCLDPARHSSPAYSQRHRSNLYSEIADEVIRPSVAERNANPRSGAAKLRWARKSFKGV